MPASVPVLLQAPERRWECPNCPAQEVTREVQPHTRYHSCGGLRGGLTAPMVPAGTRCKVEAVEREDFIGSEVVQLHQGRPVMSVRTTRDDGEDVAVFAPLATAAV
jgi:hypothetical protein